MSNPEDDEPKQRPLFQRLSVGFQPGRNHVATGFKNRPSPLAQMMIEKGREALLNGDYAESLDNLMTIKSIEEHSDIETAIALTAMDVIERLQLDNRAQIIAPQFVSSVIALRHEAFERRANKLKMLGQIFRHKRLIALRNEANRIEAGLLSSAGNGSAHEIVSDLSKTPLLQSERGSRDIFRREVRELWSASREITAEMRHLRKLIEDHGRGWPEFGRDEYAHSVDA